MYSPGVPQPSWALGDFDYDGFVDDDDVTLLGVFYNPSAPPLAASPVTSAGPAAVPEPATGLLCVLGWMIIVVAKRRQWPIGRRSSFSGTRTTADASLGQPGETQG
jgi:hypothetical protein